VPFQGDMIDIAHEETAKIMLERARELGVLDT
jgi:citrate lyase beta subunit